MTWLVLYFIVSQGQYQGVGRVTFLSGSSGGGRGGDASKFIQVVHRIQVHVVIIE